MAVAKMTKVMIVAHRSEVSELLKQVQQTGLMQVLDAERAMVTKEWPELNVDVPRQRDIEDTIAKLDSAIDFLNDYVPSERKPGVFSQLKEIDQQQYSMIVSGQDALNLMDKTLSYKDQIKNLQDKIEHNQTVIASLQPFKGLDINVEEIGQDKNSVIIAGLVPTQNWPDVLPNLEENQAVVEIINETKTHKACIIACLKENYTGISKILRSGDFENYNFDSMTGTVDQNIQNLQKQLDQYRSQLDNLTSKATLLSEDIDKLGVLEDHYHNLLNREHTRYSAPSTTHVVLLEGWLKKKHYKKIEKVIDNFPSSNISEMPIGADEDVPVEIDNNKVTKPFETITRLHGMPNYSQGDVDPTPFLAPFFALFFGLCLTDAGYGIILALFAWWLTKKIQGDKKALVMLIMCSIMSIVAGALTGGWFGDTIQVMLPENTALNSFRESLMLFDPMVDPMAFFVLSIGLGYIQIMFALFIGFFNNLSMKDYQTAVFNFLTWIIFLNSLIIYGVGKANFLSPAVTSIAGWVALLQALLIFWFSERNSGMAGRIGGGVFSLFSTVFYFGDVLSYVRLMALGMVTAGLGMAVNILVLLVMDIPYIGFILGAILFIGGHTLNLALSVLSAFVHSLRLQFVEFFPKFFTGGGTQFKPFTLSYKHSIVKTQKD